MANTSQRSNNNDNIIPELYEIDIGRLNGNLLLENQSLNGGNTLPLEDMFPPFVGNNGTNRFGLVRDRVFHVMLVKMALSYNRYCSHLMKRIVEFVALLIVRVFLKL